MELTSYHRDQYLTVPHDYEATMALLGNGTTGYIASASSFTAPTLFTAHCIYTDPAAPGTGADDAVIGVSDAGAGFDATFYWDHSTSPKTFFMKQAGGAYSQATVPAGILTNDTWYGIGIRFDGTNLAVFVNGIKVIQAASSYPTTGVTPSFVALAGAGGTNYFGNATIAEVAMWDIALEDSDMTMLGAKYFTPGQVRPDAIHFYWPLIREVVPIFGTVTSGGGLTAAAHPPIRDSWSGQIRRWTDDATYHRTSTGGLSIVGDSIVAPDFVQTCTGGVTLAGDSDVAIGCTVTTALTMATGLNRTMISTTSKMSNSFTLLDYFGNLSDSMKITSKFQADSGYLASGRISDRLD